MVSKLSICVVPLQAFVIAVTIDGLLLHKDDLDDYKGPSILSLSFTGAALITGFIGIWLERTMYHVLVSILSFLSTGVTAVVAMWYVDLNKPPKWLNWIQIACAVVSFISYILQMFAVRKSPYGGIRIRSKQKLGLGIGGLVMHILAGVGAGLQIKFYSDEYSIGSTIFIIASFIFNFIGLFIHAFIYHVFVSDITLLAALFSAGITADSLIGAFKSYASWVSLAGSVTLLIAFCLNIAVLCKSIRSFSDSGRSVGAAKYKAVDRDFV